jgi:hypothetical protein
LSVPWGEKRRSSPYRTKTAAALDLSSRQPRPPLSDVRGPRNHRTRRGLTARPFLTPRKRAKTNTGGYCNGRQAVVRAPAYRTTALPWRKQQSARGPTRRLRLVHCDHLVAGAPDARFPHSAELGAAFYSCPMGHTPRQCADRGCLWFSIGSAVLPGVPIAPR